MRSQIIGGVSGGFLGGITGILSQRNYEDKLRLEHPDWDERQIRKAVNIRKIKAAAIGSVTGGGLGVAGGYGYNQLPATSRKVPFGVKFKSPVQSTKNSLQRNSSNLAKKTGTVDHDIESRLPNTRDNHPRPERRPYLGKGRSEAYQRQAEVVYNAKERYKSMAESGEYTINSPELTEAKRVADLEYKRLRAMPEFEGTRDRLIVHPKYKQGPSQIEKFNQRFNRSRLTQVSQPKSTNPKDPKDPGNGSLGFDPSQLFGGNVNVKKSDIINYTVWFSSSDRVVCMFYDKGEGTDHLTKPCTLIEVPKIKREFQDKAKRSHWRIVDLVVAQDMDEIDDLIEEYE
jgi:hypothetical protein